MVADSDSSDSAGKDASDKSVLGKEIEALGSDPFHRFHQEGFFGDPLAISLAGSGSSGMEPSRRMRCVSGADSRFRGANSMPKNGLRLMLSMLADLPVTAQPPVRRQLTEMVVEAMSGRHILRALLNDDRSWVVPARLVTGIGHCAKRSFQLELVRGFSMTRTM
jgi:hypothetical protein